MDKNSDSNTKPRSHRFELKIADFGLSRMMPLPPIKMTKEIATLHFRAPEVMLDNLNYTQAVDMWSIGIIAH